MSDITNLLAAHRDATATTQRAGDDLGAAIAAHMRSALGGNWTDSWERGADVTVGNASVWVEAHYGGTWSLGVSDLYFRWHTPHGSGATVADAARAWMAANTRVRRPEAIAAREWLAARLAERA